MKAYRIVSYRIPQYLWNVVLDRSGHFQSEVHDRLLELSFAYMWLNERGDRIESPVSRLSQPLWLATEMIHTEQMIRIPRHLHIDQFLLKCGLRVRIITVTVKDFFLCTPGGFSSTTHDS